MPYDQSGASPPSGLTRRTMVNGAAAIGVLAFSSGLPRAARAAPAPRGIGTAGRRTLIRGGSVMSMDPAVGEFAKADVLLEGMTIKQVGVGIAAGDAAVIDATGMIVMPGFIDTHHHLFETAMRSLLSEATLTGDEKSHEVSYYETVQLKVAPHYRPRDVYISERFGALSQLDAGVTTVLDISQIHLSPEHSDAAVQALQDAGGRAVLTHSGDARGRFGDVERLRSRHFSSSDQLLSLAIGSELSSAVWESAWDLGRKMGLLIASHVVGALGTKPVFDKIAASGKFGPDNLFIHMTGVSDMAWQAAKAAGSSVSMAVPIEMSMRHGMPPIMKTLAVGIQPALSTDVEVTMTADFFTQMRSMLVLQRALANEITLAGIAPAPARLGSRDVLRFATVEGAKALRLSDQVGSLTPGKQADILLLDATAINVAPLNNVPGAVVTLMERSNVDTVIVAGKLRKWQGKLVEADLPRLRREVEASRDYLFTAANLPQNLFSR